MVSGAIKATPPSGWSVSIDGSESLNLQAGQSQKIQLEVIAKNPGNGAISISISGSSEVINSETEILLSSEGDITDDPSSTVETLFWVVWVIVPIIAILAFIILRKKAPLNNQFQNFANYNQGGQQYMLSNATSCFHCRQTILTWMRGCPSCGARYHPTCNVTHCTHCGAESSSFVNVE